MSSKNNALLQDPEALFRTRIDPKLVARIEKLDSNKVAASAVMACFLGREGEITGLAMTPTREWESGIQAGRIGYHSRDWELPSLKKCLKKKDTATARKHAARGIMFHMAAEGANAQLKQDESWAYGSLELWDMDVCEGYAESPCWPDLNPDLYADGVGASARLASLVYPRSNGWVSEMSVEANELYTQACTWIEELFSDQRVWQAVESLARELVRCKHLDYAGMLRVIDGKKGALAYLRQLASSKKWQERIGVAAHETTDETDEATAKQNAELQKLYADPKWQAKMALNSSISFAADCVVSWFLNYDAGLAPMSITRKVLLAKFQRTAKEWRNRNVRSKTLGRNGKEGRLEASDAEVRRKHAARAIMHAMASDAAWARLDGEKTWAEDRYREWRGLLLEHSEDVERWEDFNPADWDYDGIGVSVRLAGQTFPNCKVTANPGSTKAGRFYLEVCGWLDEFFADERVWNAVQTLAADFRKRGEMKPNNIPKILDGKDHTNAYLDQLALSTEWWKRIGAASTAPIDWMGIMQR